ncbi:MAG: hypothetical protein ACK54C_08885 [Betaproteobacteria bacterium]|jgi:hypothetical protein
MREFATKRILPRLHAGILLSDAVFTRCHRDRAVGTAFAALA